MLLKLKTTVVNLLKKNLFFLLLLIATISSAQPTISGRVFDVETGKIIVGANIYINKTTIGTSSNQNGYFTISNIPLGNQELIISMVGYETVSYLCSTSQLPLQIDFKLKQKVKLLDDVVITSAYTKLDLRDPYLLKKFRDAFLGVTPFSDKCVITNMNDIELKLDEKSRMMYVSAKKPIIVVNKALGYIIEYELDFFQLSFLGNRYFYGKTHFKTLDDKPIPERKKKLRKAAYYGSFTHFLRSVYDNSSNAEGFEIHSITRKRDLERDSLINILSYKSSIERAKFMIKEDYMLFGDSSAYIKRKITQPAYLPDVLSNQLLKAADLKTMDAAGNIIFKTSDSLLSVIYRKPLYGVMRNFTNQSPSFEKSIHSTIGIKPGIDVVINPKANSISKGINLAGFFSFSYGVSTMLPQNYEP